MNTSQKDFENVIASMNDEQLRLVTDYADYLALKTKVKRGKALYMNIGKHETYKPLFIPNLTIKDLNQTRDKLLSLIEYYIQRNGYNDLEYILIKAVTVLASDLTVLKKEEDESDEAI